MKSSQIQKVYRRIKAKVLRLSESEIGSATRFPDIPSSCYGCYYLHGEGVVCALHPAGLSDCPDYQMRSDVEAKEKSELFNFLYSSRRIRDSSLELLKNPTRIGLIFPESTTYPEDTVTLERIRQFSPAARKHFISVLQNGHVHREVDSKRLVITSTPGGTIDRVKIIMMVFDLFSVRVSIFWLFTSANTVLEHSIKAFCLWVVIVRGRSLISSVYNGLLFLYLREKNIALLGRIDDEVETSIERQCRQCFYFYGRTHNEQTLICSLHPNGQVDCPDFEPNQSNQRTIRISHRYSTLFNFNGVVTSMSMEDLNYACAYLQLIYDALPDLPTVQDVLVEDDCVRLLAQFYECEPIINSLQIPTDFDFDDENDDLEIDLYVNWEESAWLGSNPAILNERSARSGVKLAMIDIMLQEAIVAVEKNSTSECQEVVEQLIAIKNGRDIPLEWGLEKLNGTLYVGSIIASPEPDLLEIM